ncbi:MAG: hypothetical protein J5847_02550 [Clostridia bacterium]|nr:hypothetical protein [Clostridia bacterium]
MLKELETYHRARLITQAVKMEVRPERIPILCNAWNWKYLDAGFTLSEALYSNKNIRKALMHYAKTYPTDVVFELGTRNPFSFTQYLGSDKHYIINDEIGGMNIVDESFLEPDEYDELINDPMTFIWEKFLPRKCKNLQTPANGKAYIEGMDAFIKYLLNYVANQNIYKYVYGIPTLYDMDCPFYMMNGPDIMMDFMRGIKGLSRDMRRMPDKVKAACDALDSIYEPDMDAYQGPHGHNRDCAFDGAMVYIAHTIMNPKQFEMYYWPGLQKAAEFAEKWDKTVLLFVEGDSERLYPFFKQLPKGHFALLAETNDVFKMRKELPNICVAGGMPATMLGGADVKTCVDYAKRLCEELGSDGGYIFSSDKMLSYPTDCKRENWKAVCDFVASY